MHVKLVPLQDQDKEFFIRNIQIAFKKAVEEQFGPFDGEIIPRDHVTRAFDEIGAASYSILLDGEVVGGTVLTIHPETNRNELALLFVNVDCHSKGVGFAAWQEIELLYPKTEIWETFTPYFDLRNIHFYINKCGFHMVEFFCKAHPEPGENYDNATTPGGEGFCRFEKRMK